MKNLLKELARLQKENARLKSELMIDDLTGLYNARCLRERLEESIEKRAKLGLEPALLFLDVDHFKRVNEEHGHQAAGKILEQLGRVLSTLIRSDDVAFRYGGDEFVILVSGGRRGAELAGERIRAHIENHVFRAKGLQGLASVKITISAGIRVVRADDTAEKVLEAADRAMFEAKRNSRNSLVAA